jgi:hypothetical protein
MSGRAILSTIGDLLLADACLPTWLDPVDELVAHGSTQYCDEPPTSHVSRPVARFDQGAPGDFTRAVVRFGSLSRGLLGVELDPNLEAWTFRVSGFAHDLIQVDGQESNGSLWLEDIRDAVIRILAWQRTELPCTASSLIAIFQQFHDGTVLPVDYDENKGVWTFQEQFRWVVMSRGVTPPVDSGCCA